MNKEYNNEAITDEEMKIIRESIDSIRFGQIEIIKTNGIIDINKTERIRVRNGINHKG